MIAECTRHGLVEHSKRKDTKRLRCKSCQREDQKKHRDDKRDKLIAIKGGKCEICGYSKCNDALHFHHLRDKKFQLNKSTLTIKSKEEIEQELAKCILVCANCHSEIHSHDAK
jgi:5-methylcytosine-specific restriction endonuclease McrA